MSSLPCQNQSCHSFGHPHPNCRCYGGMAEGGKASNFCSEDRAHNSDCEYFVDGGMAGDSDLGLIPVTNAESADNDLGLIPVKDQKSSDDSDLGLVPVDQNEKYGSALEQLKTVAEGGAQGYLGALAPYLETKLLGVKPEDITGRAAANPLIHGASETAGLVGGLLSGTGEAGLISKATKAIPEIAAFGKIGSAAVMAAVQGGAFTASDETTKYLLGQQGSNPQEAVANALLHIGATSLITGAGSGLFGVLGKSLNAGGNQKIAEHAEKFLAKIGSSGDPINQAMALLYGGYQGYNSDGSIKQKLESAASGYFKAEVYLPFLAKAIGPLAKANAYTSAALMRALTTNPQGIPAAKQWASYISKGSQKVMPALDAIFKAGASQVIPDAADATIENLRSNVEQGGPQRQMIDEFHNNGQATPIAFAKGGAVEGVPTQQPEDHFASVFPEANILMNETKGRVYNYLNSQRPMPNQSKLAFDEAPSDSQAKRNYDKALRLAANPASILNHLNKGDLTPEDMKHFTALYPEVHDLLSKKLTARITKAQLSNEKPPYAKRQAMSLFLGTTLDSSLQPQAIQAAQNVFAQKQSAQQQAPMKNKKGTSSLAKSSQDYLTDDQARERRQQTAKP